MINYCLAESKLISLVEFGGCCRVYAVFVEELLESSNQNLTSCKLIPFELLPEADVYLMVTCQHGVRAFSQAESIKESSDCGALGGIEIKQRSIHIPKNCFDHNRQSP